MGRSSSSSSSSSSARSCRCYSNSRWSLVTPPWRWDTVSLILENTMCRGGGCRAILQLVKYISSSNSGGSSSNNRARRKGETTTSSRSRRKTRRYGGTDSNII